MSPEIFLVGADLPGSLFIMPCPSGDDLRRDISAYKSRGLDTVVSMLAPDEALMLGLECEDVACQRAGIEFIHSPITDFGLPDVTTFSALVRQIAGFLKDGKVVAVHCRAGIGRSGMVTAGTLIALGIDRDEAVRKVSVARGVSIPDTDEQGTFISQFASGMRSRN